MIDEMQEKLDEERREKEAVRLQYQRALAERQQMEDRIRQLEKQIRGKC